MKAFLVSVFKKLTYIIAACVIIVAIAVSVSYFLSPVVAEHRIDLEKWASDLLKAPVTINQVELSWYHYQPVVNLNAVTLFNKDSKEPALQIQKIRLFFSIPKSLWYFKPILSGILISGSEIAIHSGKTGEITVQGFPAFGGKEEPYKSETRVNDILGWLAQQPRLSLKDIDIYYTAPTGQKRFITLQNLSILNSASKHIILGDGVLHQDLPTSLNLAIDWSGDPADLQNIKANIYAYISGLSLSQWLKDSELQGWQIKSGIGTAKIWAEWNKNAIQKIQTTFQVYKVALYSATDKTTHEIDRLSGNVGWRREGNREIIAGDEILIDSPSHLWPMTSFYVDLSEDASGHLQPQIARIGYINLDDVQSFLFSSPHFLPDSFYVTLPRLKMTGNLQNASVTFAKPNWQDWSHLALNGDVVQLSMHAYEKFPGIQNLSANVKWGNNNGELEFKNNSPVKFQYDSIFANPITLNQLTGKITAAVDDKHVWKFNTDAMQILNNDIAANVKGTFTFAENASPQIDLSSHFTFQNVSHINTYLPLRIFDNDLVKWLKQAFEAGEIKSGDAILKGTLADFPFDKGNGTFSISGIVSNIDLHYAPDWPSLKKVNGKITFSGRQMTVDVDHGQVLDIPLNNIHAVIPSLGGDQPSILEVTDTNIQTNFAHGIHFVQTSPLNETIGKMFDGIEMNGPITLQLGLKVPLENTDKTQVQGDLQFKDAEMNMIPWELKITNLNGQLQFTENSTDAKGISGQLFNKPLTVDLATNNKTIEVNFKTNLAANDLQQWLKAPFSKVMQGATDVTGKIDIAFNKPLAIHLQSDLVGLALTLPYEYGKGAQETKDLNADISLPEKQPIRILLNYGKSLGAALILKKQHQEFKLQSVNLHLGSGSISWPPEAGLYISGDFDTLDWDTIKQYTKQTDQTDFSSELPLRDINIHANKLLLGGQQINQVDLKIIKNNDGWKINVNSPDASGEIQTPLQFNNKGIINVKFQNLNLNASSSNTKNEMNIDIKSLPAIVFDAGNLSYGNINLGTVHFNAIPSANGLTIKSVNISSPRMNLQASGEWLSHNETQLRGTVMSPNVSGLLSSLGMDSRNYVVNNGHVNFDLGWNDAPYAPSLAGLSGNARVDIGHGRIVDMGASNNAKMDIGRVLNLFSLQNLPRRLSLNFSDLYEKGYSFDYIRGDFTFKNGDAFTQNLEINGPVIRVAIYGHIGMREKIYDLTMSVTPHDVTSGLPVAAVAAGLVNPVIGLAAFGVTNVLNPALSHAATYTYNVTGPWSNPSWRAVSR